MDWRVDTLSLSRLDMEVAGLMSSTDSYDPGDLKWSHMCCCDDDSDDFSCTDDDACPKSPRVFYLSHQCDAWRIGGIEDAKALLVDLQRLIADAGS